MIKKSMLISLGNLFFRYRSYIPIPIIFLAFYFYFISPINKINPSIFNYCLSISLTGLLIRVLVVDILLIKLQEEIQNLNLLQK